MTTKLVANGEEKKLNLWGKAVLLNVEKCKPHGSEKLKIKKVKI